MAVLPFRRGEPGVRCHREEGPPVLDLRTGEKVPVSLCSWCQAGGVCPDAVPPPTDGP